MTTSSLFKRKRLIIDLIVSIILIILISSPCYGQSANPVDCSSYVTVTRANERSTLDRRTLTITSTADVTITNISSRPLSIPLHAVISINNANGPVTMPEALGGPGTQPYGKYYYDLSSKLINNQLPPGAQVAFGVKFVRSSTVQFTYGVSTYGVLTLVNQPPVANAGPNQTIPLQSGQTSYNVQLNGSGSSDSDGSIVSYIWSGTPDPADISNPFITLTAGSHTFTLIVTDNQGASSGPASVTITVLPPPNQPPVANAGVNRTIQLSTGQTSVMVTLDGSGSQDPDGNITQYLWTGTPDPADIVNPTISLLTSIYTFTLVVADNNSLQSPPASVTITVLPPNQVPVANAGQNQTIPLQSGQTSYNVQLNGSGSYDPDGSIVSYIWSGTPDPADISNPFITLTAGSQIFTLIVTDNQGASSGPSSVTITVLPPPNQSPVANAGANQTLSLLLGQTSVTTQLNGTGSSDPDGTIVGYAWSGTPTPAAVVRPTVSLPLGTHTFTLVVTDNQGAVSSPSLVTIQVVQAQPPVLTVPDSSFSVIQGQVLSFEISSTDPDGDPISLSATPVIKNSVFNTNSGTTARGTFTFTPDSTQKGQHFISFKARDPLGLSDTKTVQINVNKLNQPPILTLPASASVDEGKLLTIKAEATDPNGDPVSLSASGLPVNAVFIQATGTLTFAPDYNQAGTYPITITASDGQDSSSKIVQVTVNDVPGGGGPTELVLQVDPVESPTLQGKVRMTGTLNAAGTPSPTPKFKSALITGMSPTTGEQGQTLTATLTGQASGDYVTHFTQNVSQADFGAGITVTSVSISSLSQAIVTIVIGASAVEGPRSVSVTTGGETAVSVLAFNVTKGKSVITGKIIDPNTQQPVSSGTIAVQGTTISTVINPDGSFTLINVPSGSQTLIVNAPNHEFITIPVVAQSGTSVNLGEIQSKTTVFDPTAPPSSSILSVTGRGIGDTTGRISHRSAKEVVKDALLLIGGNEAGVLDEYGNQLNPLAKDGVGYVSLTSEGVRILADQMVRGDSIELQELLFAVNFGFEWSDGKPLTLDEWMQMLQEQIDAAWADPYHPNSAYAITMFNKGNGLMPDPPQISPSTRLSSLQAYIFASSICTYIFTREDPTWGSPSRFWRNAFQSRTNYLMAKYREAQQSYLQYTIGIALMPTLMSTARVCRLAIDLAALFPVLNIERFTPEPPKLKKAEFTLSPHGKESVRIYFERSEYEHGEKNYLYSLWRFNGVTDERTLVDRVLASELDPNARRSVLVDPDPPVGTHYYSMTLSLLFTAYDTITLTELQWNEPYWIDAHSGLDPMARFRTTRRVTSDYSVPLVVTIGNPLARVIIGNIEVDPKGNVFYIPPDGKTIYKVAEEGTATPVVYVDAGFANPGARGLAIDSKGNLFTDNAASDAQFGGRIFKFKPPTGGREFTGTINYFSQLLMFAHPTSAGPMAMAPDDTLMVVDQLSREIKQVAVNATYDPYRRVGQPIASLVDAAVGEAFDMEVDRDGHIYLLYLGLQSSPSAGILLGPSKYLEVPKDHWDIENNLIPTRKDGLITAYGKTQVQVNVLVLDGFSRPVSGAEVEFSADQGTFSNSKGITDAIGRASSTLETLFVDHSAPITEVEVRAYVPSLSETFTKKIPVIDNLQTLLDRYFKEIPKGLIIQNGTYYTTPWGGISGPGALNNLLAAPGQIKNIFGGKKEPLEDYVCEKYQEKVLEFLNGLRLKDPYLLNGLDYGPTSALVMVHHNTVLWDKRAPNGWKEGLFLDPWINQTPEVYDFELVRSQWFGIPIISDARPDTFKYKGEYPLTGGEFYPPKGTTPKSLVPPPKPVTGIIVDPKAPVYIEITNPEGESTGFGDDGQLRGDAPLVWYYRTPNGKTAITLPDQRPHCLRVKANAHGDMNVKILYQDGVEVNYDNVPITGGVISELIVDDSNRGQPIRFDGGQPPYDPTTTSYMAMIVGLQPGQVEAGSTVSVNITGEATHFVDGVSQGIAANGITINGLTVTSPTTATANITVKVDAPVGTYILSVQTGLEVPVPIATLEVIRNE